MSRYIDADNILYKDLSEGRGVCWVTFKDWIKEMPTADVRENVRGKWIKPISRGDVLSYGRAYYECDQCHKVAFFGNEMNFCPNCGADMRGNNNEMDSMQ